MLDQTLTQTNITEHCSLPNSAGDPERTAASASSGPPRDLSGESQIASKGASAGGSGRCSSR